MMSSYAIVAMATAFCCLATVARVPDDVYYVSENMDMSFQVLANLDFKCHVEVLLRNTGSRDIVDGWMLEFCSIRKVLADTVQAYLAEELTPLSANESVRVEHVNGCAHRLTSGPEFRLPAGGTIRITFTMMYWVVARTDIMPNWYVTSTEIENTTSKILECTKNLDFVKDFTSVDSYRRSRDDLYSPFSALQRYDRNKNKDENVYEDFTPVIPSVKQYTLQEGWIVLNKRWSIVSNAELSFEIEYLANHTEVKVVQEQTRHVIVLALLNDTNMNEEDYSIDIAKKIVSIKSPSAKGIFYAVQTLISLTTQGKAGNRKYKAARCMQIEDGPRFAYRGLMMDIVRNFAPFEELMTLVELMGRYKLNVLHLHLGDDEAWRLEIPTIPELTKYGAKVCLRGEECLSPLQLGAVNSADVPDKRDHLTSVQYRQLLEYARDRHVTIIPEFDMPGHSRAAIKSMQYRKRQQCSESSQADCEGDYDLVEPVDPSEYSSVQMFNDNAMNPCLTTTYDFIRELMKSVKKLYEDMPGKQKFNFGGDEVAHGAWLESPECQSQGFNSSIEIKKMFMSNINSLAIEENVVLYAWEDAFMLPGGVAMDGMSSETTVVTWQNIWEWGGGNRPYVLANKGFKVVIGGATHLYFDHPQEPDPEERGFYWATRFTDLKKVFTFKPDDIYSNIHDTRFGQLLNRTKFCEENDCVPLLLKDNIIGIQANLWSETVRTKADRDEMLWPRVFALAERAWHKSAWEDITDIDEDYRQNEKALYDLEWAQFKRRIGNSELPRLVHEDIEFRIPPPGVQCIFGVILANVEFSSLRVECKKGSRWVVLRNGFGIGGKHCEQVNGQMSFRSGSDDFSRKSRTIKASCAYTGQTNGAQSMNSSLFLLLLSIVFVMFGKQ